MTAPVSGADFPVLQVAVFVPLRRLFDYLPPRTGTMPELGCRVCVPFGRGGRIGLVVGHGTGSEVSRAKLKAVRAVLDETPLLSAADLRLSLIHI